MATFVSGAVAVWLTAALATAGGEVEVLPLPQGGVQPAIAVDAAGTLHAVYFVAGAKTRTGPVFRHRGDLWYASCAADAEEWTPALRVNDGEGAVSRGCFPSLALGGEGVVHVGWVTMQPVGQWYTRMTSDGAFAPARNLMLPGAVGVENGPAVITDGGDGVIVAWHEGGFRDEASRRVVMRRSADDGATFGPVVRVSPKESGVCACCGLAAHRTPGGEVLIAYRSAREGAHRDMILLRSSDGEEFEASTLDPWEVQRCPTALTAIASTAGVTVAAWETERHVRFAVLGEGAEPIEIGALWGQAQKHPSIAVNARGEVLVAWAEINGAKRGLEWALFDAEGQPTDTRSRSEVMLAPMSSSAVAARPDGSFVVVY